MFRSVSLIMNKYVKCIYIVSIVNRKYGYAWKFGNERYNGAIKLLT